MKYSMISRSRFNHQFLRRGDRLPTEVQLAKMFNCSCPTVSKSLNHLQELKLVERVRGSGTYVSRQIKQKYSRKTVAVMIVGDDANLSGESHSRAFIDLPGLQTELVERIAETGTPVVLVVMAGRPLTLGILVDKVDSILYAWHPGAMAGPAILDLLSGAQSPSGKLSVSFPHTVGQIPVYHSRKNTGRPPQEGDRGIPAGTPLDPVGFGSYYLDVDFKAQFPFGYALTYSTVEYGAVELSSTSMETTGSLTASCEVTNSGDTAITEIVQLYVRDLVGSVTRPIKELKDFKRVSLAPGETVTVSFEFQADQLAFHNRKMCRVVEPGDFHLWIAPNSEAGKEVSFTVK